jgi:azurin
MPLLRQPATPLANLVARPDMAIKPPRHLCELVLVPQDVMQLNPLAVTIARAVTKHTVPVA